MSNKRPLWPRMTAVVGNDPKLIANSGKRAYFPHIVMHGDVEDETYNGGLTINEGGNQCRQPDEDSLKPFDRLALLFAAAPDLLAVVQQLAEECHLCDGTGTDAVGHIGACEECAGIRAVIAKATGQQP